jgi:hypothetical protein
VGETVDYRLISPSFEHQSCIVGMSEVAGSVDTWERDGNGRRTDAARFLLLTVTQCVGGMGIAYRVFSMLGRSRQRSELPRR